MPVSLIGTFGAMYLLGYSIDNLSLMALTVATGFVVDDAIVVIENVTRHLEEGKTPLEAALLGAQEIGFTVLTISVSLIAVFIPILLMGGIVGRLFREFAVTLSIAIAVSHGHFADDDADDVREAPAARARARSTAGSTSASERAFDWILDALPPLARLGPPAPAADARGHARDDGRDGLPLREGPQGILSRSRTRAA